MNAASCGCRPLLARRRCSSCECDSCVLQPSTGHASCARRCQCGRTHIEQPLLARGACCGLARAGAAAPGAVHWTVRRLRNGSERGERVRK
eukprot:5228808-Prymnesium_polylepis.1